MQNTKIVEDLFGQALLDYLNGDSSGDILTHSSLAGKDIMPLAYLFRNFEAMPRIEQRALQLCHGHVLDVGCGAGGHALWLQKQGLEVTSIDSSKGAVEVCLKRGIKRVMQAKLLNYEEEKFDTILLMMNGIGLAGKLENLTLHLNHLKGLLTQKGQILLDSSNIIYMFDQDEDGGYWIPGDGNYYGQVTFQMEYKKQRGPVFDWLYLDFRTLSIHAGNCGLHAELVMEDEHFGYLAKLTDR